MQKCVGDFCCIKFGGFSRGFFWALFPTEMKRENPATKSAKKKPGGPKAKIRKKSVLPKTDPNYYETGKTQKSLTSLRLSLRTVIEHVKLDVYSKAAFAWFSWQSSCLDADFPKTLDWDVQAAPSKIAPFFRKLEKAVAVSGVLGVKFPGPFKFLAADLLHQRRLTAENRPSTPE